MPAPKPAGYWTLERCKADALQYPTRSQWQTGSYTPYRAAFNAGWLDACCGHMSNPQKPSGYWSLERCVEDAKLYSTRTEWRRGNPSASSIARKAGWMGECCGHMQLLNARENNVVYVWKAPGETYNGKQVYKIGSTSACRGEERVRAVNKDAEIIILQPVQGKATEHEAVLHILGDDPQYATGDGRTEFRALSDSELQEAIQYIEEVAA